MNLKSKRHGYHCPKAKTYCNYRPKSVRTRCEIGIFSWRFCAVTLLFGFFRGCRGVCHRTESDLFLFSRKVIVIEFEVILSKALLLSKICWQLSKLKIKKQKITCKHSLLYVKDGSFNILTFTNLSTKTTFKKK